MFMFSYSCFDRNKDDNIIICTWKREAIKTLKQGVYDGKSVGGRGIVPICRTLLSGLPFRKI